MSDLDPEAKSPVSSWHTIPAQAVAHRLASNIVSGLTDSEAAERRERFGENVLRQQPTKSVWLMIADQLSDFMILVLVAAALMAGVLGEPKDSIVILVIVALNAAVGAFQEWRSERALEMLRRIAAPNARILRGGEQRIASAREIVPGDIVMLSEGDIIPADLRLIEANMLSIDESKLTGESLAITKNLEAKISASAALGDRFNMAYKGTVVAHGRGVGIAVATGMETEIGCIAGMLESAERLRTPLQRRLARFGQWLAFAILLLCALIFIFGVIRGEPPLLMFLTAVSLSVAAVPEALPAVVTVALALGAREMMRHNALARALPAVETLGSVTTICSDKTGTLTLNRMHVDMATADGETLDLDGKSDNDRRIEALIFAMALCSNAAKNAEGELIGDPTEAALSERAAAAGAERRTLEERFPRIGEFAFDSHRKRMTTLHRDGAGLVAFAKGAPEALLPRCTTYQTRSGDRAPLEAEKILAEAEGMANEGLRVLAFAERRWPDTSSAPIEGIEEIEQSMTFLGLVGLLDPPRPEVREAVALCRSAGITPVMITGDHPATARRIGQQLGFVDDSDLVVSGQELRALSDAKLASQVGEIRVYARADPAQKIRIVKALQGRGEIVAMTGDGVNDAPALKCADIGVAMGRGGTDVAREAASLVLLDDNFATVVGAVREGRRIYDNIRKFIKYTMASNSGEIWTVSLAPFLGLPIPLMPIHILWINLVTDGLPGLALAIEPEEGNVMHRPPHSPNESIFACGMWQHIIWCGLAMGAVCLSVQAWAISTGREETWQTMVFTVLTLSQMGHVLTIRSEHTPMLSARFFSNSALLGAVGGTLALQLAVIYVPYLNDTFETAPLSAIELAICFCASTTIAVLVEIEKWLARHRLIYSH